MIAHPHTHALGASTPPAPPQQDGRWDLIGRSHTSQLVDLSERSRGLSKFKRWVEVRI
uniref:Transferrin variant A-like protein n=1 Tax=Synechococcus elongatus (strain ATCC 33912 / PCC 7942 / FACHB-805) TaxID=1140 RepID=Q8KPQ1_SYNE7|nr:transferrin variant A-like protein [Synechococcus elongatus PCC 7942 = FACHB-805]